MLGRVALAAGDAATSADAFAESRRLARESRMRHPALFLAFADEAEAAAEAHRLEQAAEALDEAGRLGAPPPWVEPVLLRASAALLAAGDRLEDAARLLNHARGLPTPALPEFHRARTLLTLGVVQRRLRRRKASRQLLEEAAAAFSATGAEAWAERARASSVASEAAQRLRVA